MKSITRKLNEFHIIGQESKGMGIELSRKQRQNEIHCLNFHKHILFSHIICGHRLRNKKYIFPRE